MSKDQAFIYARAAFELTKMVAVIAAHTTIKLVQVGREEVARQYVEYHARATKQQKEALSILTDAANRGRTQLSNKVASATADARQRIENEKKSIGEDVKKKLEDVSGSKKKK